MQKKDEVGAIGKLKNQGEKKIGISKQNKTKELNNKFFISCCYMLFTILFILRQLTAPICLIYNGKTGNQYLRLDNF